MRIEMIREFLCAMPDNYFAYLVGFVVGFFTCLILRSGAKKED